MSLLVSWIVFFILILFIFWLLKGNVEVDHIFVVGNSGKQFEITLVNFFTIFIFMFIAQMFNNLQRCMWKEFFLTTSWSYRVGSTWCTWKDNQPYSTSCWSLLEICSEVRDRTHLSTSGETSSSKTLLCFHRSRFCFVSSIFGWGKLFSHILSHMYLGGGSGNLSKWGRVETCHFLVQAWSGSIDPLNTVLSIFYFIQIMIFFFF